MVKTPIETSKDWLKTAEITLNAERYGQSLYALEMSVEIAFKAVLLSIHVEVPKVHDIRKTVKTFLSGNKKMPKKFADELDDYLSTFENLLSLRSIVGYGFESGLESAELEKQAESLVPKCHKIIIACEYAIKNIEK
jgi:HEPN domain-containing protein